MCIRDRVDSAGDSETDHVFKAEQQRTAATNRLLTNGTMTMYWTPPAGHWLFHCHFVPHMSPEMTVANALADKFSMEHPGNHMAGMVLGITVTGDRPPVAAHGRTRKIRLWVRERPAGNGLPAGFSYQVEENHRLFPKDLTVPGPPLILAAWTGQREIGVSQIRRHRLADDYRHSTLPIHPSQFGSTISRRRG